MKIENIDGLRDYIISYNDTKSGSKKHYSNAKLMHKGYLIVLDSVYYETLDEAVQGLKDRLIQAIKDFDIKLKESNHG
jgi:hypothetical protein